MAGNSVEISGAGSPSLSRIRAGTLSPPLNLSTSNTVTTTNTQIVGTTRGIEINALTGKFIYPQAAGVGFKMGNYGTYLGSPKVYIGTDTAAGADTYSFTLVGAGDSDATRGAAFTLFGINHPDTRKGSAILSLPTGKEFRVIGDASAGSTAYDMIVSTSGVAVSNNSSHYKGLLTASALTADRTLTIPDATGTLTLYDQIIPHPVYFNGEGKLLQVKALTSGDNDIGTPPAGKKWVVTNSIILNPTGGSITVVPARKTSGTYYRLATAVAVTTNSFTATGFGSFVFESGDTVAINCSAANCACELYVIEFDATSPLKTARLNTSVSGNNTLYTCPSGYWAAPVTVSPSGFTVGAINVYNGNGPSSCYLNFVKSGDSPTAQGTTSNTNIQIPAAQSISSATLGPSTNTAMPLAAGDYYNVNINNTSSHAWVTVLEAAL